MSKPRIDFNWERFNGLLVSKPTKKFCAFDLECSEETIERRIKEKYDMTFTEYRDCRMGKVKHAVFQRALNKALGGSEKMQMFFLERYCGFHQKQDVEVKAEQPISIEYVKREK